MNLCLLIIQTNLMFKVRSLLKLNLSLRKQKSKSSSESQASISSSDYASDEKKRKHKHSKYCMKDKASDSVRKSQRYPKTHLRFDNVSSNMSFEKLNISLFLASEIKIISDKLINENDKKDSLELLKKIMHSSNSYEFTVLESYYAAVLRERQQMRV